MIMSLDLITSLEAMQDPVVSEELADALEQALLEANMAIAKGDLLFSDAIYDTYKSRLQELRPDSPIFDTVWSEPAEGVEFDEELDKYLAINNMLSISTIKSFEDRDFRRFKEGLPNAEIAYFAGIKENGHGVTIRGVDGVIKQVSKRGRGKLKGGDITRQVIEALGTDTIEGLRGLGVFDIRGEICCPFSAMPDVHKYNASIVSAFSAVQCLTAESAPASANRLLRVVCYDIFCDNRTFTSFSEVYAFLEDCGFTIPLKSEGLFSRDTLESDMQELMNYMEEQSADYDIYTDGIVVNIDDKAVFDSLGAEKSVRLGNIALKMGKWKQDSYSAAILEIVWKRKKSRYTPTARVSCLTASGNTVTSVPLYAPCYILLLEAYAGNVINFRYGSEAGVLPCMPDGTLVTDKRYKAEIEGLCTLMAGFSTDVDFDVDADGDEDDDWED